MSEKETLFNDQFAGEATKRALSYIQSQRELGKKVAGIYCGYAPLELLYAMDLVPAVLCAFSNATIETAETTLPANLCPLIKSSYGFIVKDTCPFFSLSDAVIAETTCDGKKKMFELISEKRPMYVMDLPQLPDASEAKANWAAMIRNLKTFLEKTFQKTVSDEDLEKAIKSTNEKNQLIRKIFDFSKYNPPVITWLEMYEVACYAQPAHPRDAIPVLKDVIQRLEKRLDDQKAQTGKKSPRVVVTGCPIGGDSSKVYKIIEESGATVVAIDSCTGMKPFMYSAPEGTKDPYMALSEKYLQIPCSCMSPNTRRLNVLSDLIKDYKADAVVDVVLQACHSYNIESHKV
ncbi:MAG TPA: double-cubane-cluster-containing anaerobic reductase, partial [Spirochaetota bacterium]